MRQRQINASLALCTPWLPRPWGSSARWGCCTGTQTPCRRKIDKEYAISLAIFSTLSIYFLFYLSLYTLSTIKEQIITVDVIYEEQCLKVYEIYFRLRSLDLFMIEILPSGMPISRDVNLFLADNTVETKHWITPSAFVYSLYVGWL